MTEVKTSLKLENRRILTLFVDEEPFRILNRKIFGRKFSIPKSFASIDHLNIFLEKKEIEGARKYLLYLLARRSYLSDEAKKKLIENGVSQKLSEKVVHDLDFYFDDKVSLLHFVKKQLEKGCGPLLIRCKLKAKGIKDSEIEMALLSIDCDQIVDAIQNLIEKLTCSKHVSRPEKQKIFQKLIRRGFSSELIKDAFELANL